MSSKIKITIMFAMTLCLAGLWWIGRSDLATVTYSQFLEQVRGGQVAAVTVAAGASGPNHATCLMKDGRTVQSVLPSDLRDAMRAMEDNRVGIEIRESRRLLLNAAPFLLLLGLWIVLMIWKFPNGGPFIFPRGTRTPAR